MLGHREDEVALERLQAIKEGVELVDHGRAVAARGRAYNLGISTEVLAAPILAAMRFAVALVLIAAAGSATAQTPAGEDVLPGHDVDAACAALADKSAKNGGTSRNVTMNLCLQEEQEGYDTSKLLWDRISPLRRRECLQHASGFGQANYYRALGGCLEAKGAVEDNERQMQQLRSKPQGFRY